MFASLHVVVFCFRCSIRDVVACCLYDGVLADVCFCVFLLVDVAWCVLLMLSLLLACCCCVACGCFVCLFSVTEAVARCLMLLLSLSLLRVVACLSAC